MNTALHPIVERHRHCVVLEQRPRHVSATTAGRLLQLFTVHLELLDQIDVLQAKLSISLCVMQATNAAEVE